MKTRIPGRLNTSDSLQRAQVRPPAVRLRGGTAVAVASIAASSPRASDSASSAYTQLHAADYARSHSGSADVVPGALASLSTPGDAASLASEHAAKLERAASSGLATTSSGGISMPSSSGVHRRRFSGTAGKSPGAPEGRPSGPRGGAGTFVRNNEFQPREFTAQLTAASSVKELQRLFEAGRKHDINAIHVATLWTRLAKLVTGPPPRRSQDRGGPKLNSDVRAAPRASATGPAPHRPEPAALLAFVDELEAATTAEQLADMAPRGLANLVWAAAKLKPEAQDGSNSSIGVARAEASSPVGELSAAEGGDAGAQETEAGTSEGERQRPLRVRGGRRALEAAAAAAAADKQAQEAAAGRLSSTVVSEALLDAWAAAAARKLSGFSMQDISNVVWALGRLGYQPRGLFMTQLSIALLKELPRADRPQQVSNVLLGLALLRFTPAIKDFWPPVWEAVGRLVLAEQREPDVQGVTNTLWALSQLLAECPETMPAVPSALISKAVFRAVQYGNLLSGPQCQDVFVALPRLGFEPSEYQSSKLLALALRLMPSCDGQALTNIMTALVALRVQPWRAWKAAARDTFRQRLADSSPEAAARFLFAWAHMHEAPPVWTPQVWEKLHREVDCLTASDIAFVVLGANQMFPRLTRRARDADADALQAPQQEPQAQQEQEQAGTVASESEEPHEGTQALKVAAAASSSVVDVPEAAADTLPSSSAAASISSGAASAVGASGLSSEEFDGGEEVAGVAPARRRKAPADGGVKARLPSRQFLLALRNRWEAVGAEAQLSVVYSYRALVQEFFDTLQA